MDATNSEEHILPHVPHEWNWHWDRSAIFHPAYPPESSMTTDRPPLHLDAAGSDPFEAWKHLQEIRAGYGSSQNMQRLPNVLTEFSHALATASTPLLRKSDATFAQIGVGPDASMAKVAHHVYPRADINYIDADEDAGARAVEDLERYDPVWSAAGLPPVCPAPNSQHLHISLSSFLISLAAVFRRHCLTKEAHFDLVTEPLQPAGSGNSSEDSDDADVRDFLPGTTPFSAVFVHDSLAYAAAVPAGASPEQAKSRCGDLFRLCINSLQPGGQMWVAERSSFLTCTEVLELMQGSGFTAVEVHWCHDGIFLCRGVKPRPESSFAKRCHELSSQLEAAIKSGNYLQAHAIQGLAEELMQQFPRSQELSSTQEVPDMDVKHESSVVRSDQNGARPSRDVRRQFEQQRKLEKQDRHRRHRDLSAMQRQRNDSKRDVRAEIGRISRWWTEYNDYIASMERQLKAAAPNTKTKKKKKRKGRKKK